MSAYYIFATWYITKVRLCKNSVSVGTKQHVWAHTKNCHSRIKNIRCLYSRLGFPLDATVPHPCRHFYFTPKTRYAKWLGPTSSKWKMKRRISIGAVLITPMRFLSLQGREISCPVLLVATIIITCTTHDTVTRTRGHGQEDTDTAFAF